MAESSVWTGTSAVDEHLEVLHVRAHILVDGRNLSTCVPGAEMLFVCYLQAQNCVTSILR